MGTRASKIHVVNVGHAVGRNERDALAEDVESGFETEYGSGAFSDGSDLARSVHSVSMCFETCEEFEPCEARGVVVWQGPFVVCNVVPNLVE